MTLSLDQFNYHLPSDLIAQKPLPDRSSSRLLNIDKLYGNIHHYHFYDLPSLLDKNTVLVRNNTKVIPARIFGQKKTGGHIELLLTKRVRIEADGEVWECLSKPGLHLNQLINFPLTNLTATCVEVLDFARLVKFNAGGEQLFELLDLIGHTPIPPYIEWADTDELHLREVYQTTYAQFQGSAAAPTAGLQFTPELDQQLLNKGIMIEEVTLHVGLGTFLPVKSNDITQHHLHSEWFELKAEVANRLNIAKAQGKKILSVGTTTTRVLETCTQPIDETSFQLQPQTGETEIYIYPPYRFKFVDSLITNFHLPKSTLLMLVTALVSQPNTDQSFTSFLDSYVGKAYQAAIKENYRFYSFGDAMLIH